VPSIGFLAQIGMTKKQPAIARTFRDLSDKEVADAERASSLAGWGWSRNLGWDELLKSKRILIMSEAGVGKTHECQARKKLLWDNGEPAFYLDLATLAREDLRNMLLPEEEERLDKWLNAQSEVATFFLDSYDELALSQGSFAQALIRLNKALIPHNVAVDPQVEYRERVAALDALIALNDARLPAIVSAFESDPARWNAALLRSAIPRLFPKSLSVAALCRVLERVQEPKRAVGELSWHLPRLIADSDLSLDALEDLRAGLTGLVTRGAEWRNDKWPHTHSQQPDLVISLIAVCVRLFRLNKISPELFKSSVMALRFTKERDIDDAAAKELRAFIAAAPGADREAALWADDAFLQSLHPQPDAWHRLYELTHQGAIRLSPEKDTAWVLARMANPREPRDRREMMLYAAMIDLASRDQDYIAYLDRLKPHVADDADLIQIIERRQKPSKDADEIRRMEEESAERRRRSEAKDAQARASWVKFWREIAEKPDAVFDPSRSDNTAWNLWRAMERSGENSRESGWNRRFIERQFSSAVADRLRTALMQMWRKDKPTLRSERPEGEKNTYLVKWQLGLAAIAAEAEDPLWATKLTDEQAKLAARFAPLELNGFPSWLDALVAAHPAAVDAVLGNELSLSLREPLEHTEATIFLQNVRHAPSRVAALFEPRIVAWLDETRGGKDDNSGEAANRLSQVIETLMKSENPTH
jgi:hypothetical protein